MADHTIITEEKKTISIEPIMKDLIIEAGGKISDDIEIVSIANKTVPAGYRVRASIRMSFSITKI